MGKQQEFDAELKAIQQISFTGNLSRGEGARMYFITVKAEETVLHFWKGTVKVLWFYFVLI